MASSTSSSATPSRAPSFESRVQDVKLNKSLINELVMDYLIREGYPQAATNFAKEANIEPRVETESIQERVEIRNSICAGQIQQAIERINELDPEILDDDPSLHFALLRLQLIELARPAIEDPEKNLDAALRFASENLAPRATTSPDFLTDLEETMTLLIFSPGKIHPSLARLLEPELRRTVAKRVNEAVLANLGEQKRNRLYDLVNMREWAEKRTRDARKDIPQHIDIGLETIKMDGEDSIMNLDSNGHQDATAVMT